MVSGSSTGSSSGDIVGAKELWVSDKWSFMPAVTPTATQAGWATSNVSSDRTIDCDVPAEVGDGLGTLIADLIAKGILSA